jgi:hypothetical protein
LTLKGASLNDNIISHTRQVVGDAEAEYLAFFAGKAVAMIRAPDKYVYPAPFNLVEICFVAPLELVYRLSLTQLADEPMRRSFLSPSAYAEVQSCRGSIVMSNVDRSSTAFS